MASQSIRDFMERSPHAFNENVEHQILLYEIVQQLQTAERFFDVLPEVEEKLKALVHAEHVVVFKRGRHQRELSTRVDIDDTCREFHVRFNPRSIAGFVAMTGSRVCVQDTTDTSALHAIHENLKPMSELETLVDMKSTLAVPIRHGDTLIGVFQLINRTDGNFTKSELARVEVLADMLGEHFYEELGVTGGPFEQLILERQISTEELEDANDEAERSGRSVAWVLKEDHGVNREHILESMSSYYQIPSASATLNASVPAKLVEQINQNYFMNEGWLPVAESGRDIIIVIADPNDSQKVMSIERLFPGKQIQLQLMILEEIHRLIDSALSADYGAETSIDELTSRATEEFDDASVEAMPNRTIQEHAVDGASNVIKLLNQIIANAHSRGASDIHLQPNRKGTAATVLFRIDGECQKIATVPGNLMRPLVARLKVMCEMDLSEHRVPQDGKCKLRMRGQSLEVRVAVIPNAQGSETAVMRLLANCEAMHLSGLALSERNLAELEKLSDASHGLLLVVGPTGSGKTTTLHSVLGHINDGKRVIWTVEDPVEITQDGLQQVNVNRRQGLTFAKALKSFLRADPDVIFVGEMRDEETASTAIQAAMTGHLVLSSLHTNSAAETINRLRSMDVNPFDLADSLRGILSQRLVRKVCAGCKTDHQPDKHEVEVIEHALGLHGVQSPANLATSTIADGKGCEECNGTGYRGRIGVHELLIATPDVRTSIATGVPVREIVKTARAENQPSQACDALEKLLNHDIDLATFRKLTF